MSCLVKFPRIFQLLEVSHTFGGWGHTSNILPQKPRLFDPFLMVQKSDVSQKVGPEYPQY